MHNEDKLRFCIIEFCFTKKVRNFNTITHVQQSIFCPHNFSEDFRLVKALVESGLNAFKLTMLNVSNFGLKDVHLIILSILLYVLDLPDLQSVLPDGFGRGFTASPCMTSRPSSFTTNDGESCVCMCFFAGVGCTLYYIVKKTNPIISLKIMQNVWFSNVLSDNLPNAKFNAEIIWLWFSGDNWSF